MRQIDTQLFGQGIQLATPIISAIPQLPGIVVTRRQRNVIFNGLTQVLQILILQVILGELREYANHAAPNIHAHGGGNDRTLGAEHSAHAGPQARVRIRHQRDMRPHKRHSSQLTCLLQRGFLHLRSEDFHLPIRDVHVMRRSTRSLCGIISVRLTHRLPFLTTCRISYIWCYILHAKYTYVVKVFHPIKKEMTASKKRLTY